MTLDPRTLEPIRQVARCHLVPEWTGISNKTVGLDEETDNTIGHVCDAQLKKHLKTLFGQQLPGKVAMVGGSNSLSAVFDVKAQVFRIRRRRSNSPAQFAARALGAKDGKVTFGGFVGDVADGLAADISIIHSAFLILYHRGEDVFVPRFDRARGLFKKALAQTLDKEDDELTRAWVYLWFAVRPDKASASPPTIQELRYRYDPDCDLGDGILDDFPTNCVRREGSDLIVTVPYPKNLRGVVRFPG